MITQNGDLFTIGSCGLQHDKLPPGYYMVADHPKIGLHLKAKSPYKIPRKIYGDIGDVDIWEKTWKRGNLANMGILLYGIKGSGKSMEGHIFAQRMNLPVIQINQPFHDEYFYDFITDPALEGSVLFFDEFEKVYHKDEWQGAVLSLFDGVLQGQIFIVTINETSKVRPEFFNRPGRLRYAKEYQSLSQDIVDQFLADKNVYEGGKRDILRLHTAMGMMTFDLLSTLYKEHMIHGDDFITCANRMNLMKENTDVEAFYEINGVEISCSFMDADNAYDADDRTYNCGQFFDRQNLDRLNMDQIEQLATLCYNTISKQYADNDLAKENKLKSTINSGNRAKIRDYCNAIYHTCGHGWWVEDRYASTDEEGVTTRVETGIDGVNIIFKVNPFKMDRHARKLRLKPQKKEDEQPVEA